MHRLRVEVTTLLVPPPVRLLLRQHHPLEVVLWINQKSLDHSFKRSSFVSHWWGTPFFDALRMLKLHAKHRGLSETDNYYWICTFANNQHNIELDINDMDYLKTPFARALLSGVCEGTVMLLDEARATPFSRMWCVFELYITTVVSRHRFKLRGLLFDIATIIPARECKNALGELNQRCAGILLEKSEFNSNGEIKDDACRKDVLWTDHVGGSSRAWFPARVTKLGFLVDVREGQASMDGDRKWILGIIKGREEEVNLAVQRKLYRATSATRDRSLCLFLVSFLLNQLKVLRITSTSKQSMPTSYLNISCTGLQSIIISITTNNKLYIATNFTHDTTLSTRYSFTNDIISLNNSPYI